jgi:hypothetical protein
MALSERIKADLKEGINIEWFYSKYYRVYVTKPSILFSSNCETIDELLADGKKYPYDASSEMDIIICAWLAVNHYDEFINLIMEDNLKIKQSIEMFHTFACCVEIWCGNFDYGTVNWPDRIYKLLQKLFDDLIVCRLDHSLMWSNCLKSAILAKDVNRVAHLMETLELINTHSTDNRFDEIFRNIVTQYGDIFVELYPQVDVNMIEATNVKSLHILKYMMNYGYKLTHDDLLRMMWNYKINNKKEAMDNFFIENAYLLNLANENQIDEFFALSIKSGSLAIFNCLLENFNPDLNKKTKIYCRRCNNFNPEFHYISVAIRCENWQIVMNLMNHIDLANVDDELLLEIFETIVWSGDRCDDRLMTYFTDAINPTPELLIKFLGLILNVGSFYQMTNYKINKRLILMAIKLGCVFDEEYLYKIMALLDVDTFDHLMKMLNLTLIDLPENIINDIVIRYHKFCETKLKNVCGHIQKFKFQQYVPHHIKQKFAELCKSTKSKLEILYTMNLILVDGLYSFIVDWDLFVKLYKFYLINNPAQISNDLLERTDKVVEEMFAVVEKCYDHQTVNENGGIIPKQIVWD